MGSLRRLCFAIALLAFLSAISFFSNPTEAQQLDWRKLSKALESTATVTVVTDSGETVTGMAFLSGHGDIAVTALSLLEDARKVELRFPDGSVMDAAGVVDSDEGHGLAFLKLQAPAKAPLNLAPVRLDPGAAVHCAAARDGDFGFVQLQVAEIHQGPGGVERYLLFGDAPEGLTGAPVLGPDGGVVGMLLEEGQGQGLRRVLVPAAYIQVLDFSAEARPWPGSVPAGSKKTAQEENLPAENVFAELDRDLAGFLNLLSSNRALYVWANVKSKGYGFKEGVPQEIYNEQIRFQQVLGKTSGIKTEDALRSRALAAAVTAGRNQNQAIEYFIQSIVVGQQADSWTPQAEDLFRRCQAHLQIVVDTLSNPESKVADLMEASEEFREALLPETTYDLGLVPRPSSFRIGVVARPETPFSLLVVLPDSFGASLGLRPGDRIVSAGGHTFGERESLEDFKMIIQDNLGKPLAVVVEREGKTQTLNVKLPKEIPAQHLY
jgi:hypothetical protein